MGLVFNPFTSNFDFYEDIGTTPKLTSVRLKDQNDTSFYCELINSGSPVSTDNRILTLNVGDADRTLSLLGNLSVTAASTINQDVSTTASPAFIAETIGKNGAGGSAALITLLDGNNPGTSETLTYAKWNSLNDTSGIVTCNGSGSFSAQTVGSITTTNMTLGGTATNSVLGAGLTINTPQDVATSASPTFLALTLGLNGAGGTAGSITLRDGLNPGTTEILNYAKWNSLNDTIGIVVCNGSGSFSAATDSDLSAYAKLAGRAGGQSLVGGTAASDLLTLESTSNGTKGTVQSKDNFVIKTGNELRLNNATDTFYSALKSANVVANKTWTLPLIDGGAGEALVTNGSGILSFATVAEADTLSSVMGRGASTTVTMLLQNAAALELGKDDATNIAGSLKLWSAGANNFYTTLMAGTQTASVNYILPTADGSSNNVLKTNGSGVLSWGTLTEADTLDIVTGRGASTTVSCLFQNAAAIELGKDDATNTAGSIKLWSAGANNFFTTLTTGEQTASVNYVLPLADGTSGQVLSTNASGVLSWATRLSSYTETDTLASVTGRGATTTDAIIIQHASGLELGKDDATNTAGKIKLWGAGTNNFYTSLITGTQTASVDYILPTADGSSGQVLSTNASGVLSWVTRLASYTETDTLAAVTARGATTADAVIFQHANGVEIGKDDATNTAGKIKLWGAGANNFYTTMVTGTQTASVDYTLPLAAPSVNGQNLQCTTAGVMSWDYGVRKLITTKTASATLSDAEFIGGIVLLDGTSAVVDIGLPTPSAANSGYVCKLCCINAVNQCTITNTIGGVATYAFSGINDFVNVFNNGTNYYFG